jgi:hypothetical protein
MRAMGALTMGLVPRDAVDNAICTIVEKLP